MSSKKGEIAAEKEKKKRAKGKQGGQEVEEKEKDASYLFERHVWTGLRQLRGILEPIKDVSERLEGDQYVTISDTLYFLLNLIYNKVWI